MRWFKVAAIAAGVLIAFLVISSIIGFLMEAVIAALVVAGIVLAIKVAFYRRQVAWNKPDSQVRGSAYSSLLARHERRDVDDELARLKREMGGYGMRGGGSDGRGNARARECRRCRESA